MDYGVDGKATKDTEWISAEGRVLSFKKSTDAAAGEKVLWEPGCTYELPTLRVANNGNLAFEYKVQFTAVNTTDEGLELAKVLDVTMNGTPAGTLHDALTSTDADGHAHGKLEAGENSEINLSIKMREGAGNSYKGLSIGGIAVTILAKQDTVEYDSYTSNYDAEANYYVYPAGVTAESFEGDRVACVTDADGKLVRDKNGNVKFYNGFGGAVNETPDGGTVYLKENTNVTKVVSWSTNKNITIQGNGADFSGSSISIGTDSFNNQEKAIEIYNAKNLTVLGYPRNTNNTWNVKMSNCTNDRCSLFAFHINTIANTDKKDKLNLTVETCMVSGYTENKPVISTTVDGSVVIKNSVFTDCSTPIEIIHRQWQKIDAAVEDCTFANCGTENYAPVHFAESYWNGKLTVALKNNIFMDTVNSSTTGDILLGSYGKDNKSYAFDATITTEKAVMVKSSASAPQSCTGGTISVAKTGT